MDADGVAGATQAAPGNFETEDAIDEEPRETENDGDRIVGMDVLYASVPASEVPASDVPASMDDGLEDEPVPDTELAAPAEGALPVAAMAPPSPREQPESAARHSVGAATQEAAAVLGGGELGGAPAEEEGEEEKEEKEEEAEDVSSGSDAEEKGSESEDTEEVEEEEPEAAGNAVEEPEAEEPEAEEPEAEEPEAEEPVEPALVAKVAVPEEEKENSAPVDASVGKELPFSSEVEDVAAVPLSFLED